MPYPNPHAPARRRTLGLFVGLLAAPVHLLAADDLLDPSILSRKGGGAPSPKIPIHPGTATALSPSHARTMAEAVVTSMAHLVAHTATRAADIERLDRQMAELSGRLRRMRDEASAKMDEYRRGLFCSGCGKTKSEILAVGDKFPHPGQSIVKPTAEEIRAKERLLQAPLDAGNQELRRMEDNRGRAKNEREEGLAQIDAGVSLWTTSISFERNIVQQQARQAEAAARAAAAKADKGVAERRRAAAAAVARAAESARRDEGRLNELLARQELAKFSIPLASASASASQAADFNSLGGLYRMGAADPRSRDEHLPRVEAFIGDFRRGPAAALGEGPAPTPGGAPASLKDQLKNLAACDPGDPSCTSKK